MPYSNKWLIDDRDTSRRRVLRGLGAATSEGGLTAVAGCTGDDDDDEPEVGGEVEVELTYDPARLHLFDPKTGDAIYHSEPAIELPDRVESAAGE